MEHFRRTTAWTGRVYAELLARAGRLLGLGESVIVDASFISPAQRAAAAAAAAAVHADLAQLRCTATAEVTAQRLAARTGHVCGASDADAGIARQMAAAAAPWPDAVTIDTSQPSPVTPASRPVRWCGRPWRPSGRTAPSTPGARTGQCCSPAERPRQT